MEDASCLSPRHLPRVFLSNEGTPREPMHVHVQSGNAEAKVWIEPRVAIAASKRFNAKTLGEILEPVSSRREDIERAWHGHFGD
jgi:hypothetical protein